MGHALVVLAAVGVPTWCPALGACQLSTLPSPWGAGLNPVLWLMEQRLIKALPEVTQPVGGGQPPELSPCKVLSPPRVLGQTCRVGGRGGGQQPGGSEALSWRAEAGGGSSLGSRNQAQELDQAVPGELSVGQAAEVPGEPGARQHHPGDPEARELPGNPEQARLEGVTPSQKSSLEVGRWAGILTASSFL